MRGNIYEESMISLFCEAEKDDEIPFVIPSVILGFFALGARFENHLKVSASIFEVEKRSGLAELLAIVKNRFAAKRGEDLSSFLNVGQKKKTLRNQRNYCFVPKISDENSLLCDSSSHQSAAVGEPKSVEASSFSGLKTKRTQFIQDKANVLREGFNSCLSKFGQVVALGFFKRKELVLCT